MKQPSYSLKVVPNPFGYGSAVSISMRGIYIGKFCAEELDWTIAQARAEGDKDYEYVLQKAIDLLTEEMR